MCPPPLRIFCIQQPIIIVFCVRGPKNSYEQLENVSVIGQSVLEVLFLKCHIVPPGLIGLKPMLVL